MAVNLTSDQINELLALVEGRMIAVEAEQAAAPHSNQALMQEEIDLLIELQEKLQAAAAAGANAMGGRRSGRKTRKARKGRKGSRKGSRKARKGSRKARKGSRRA
jgi:ribosomal protein L19E